MKNTYTAPRITVVDMEVETQILAGSQIPVKIESGENQGVFYSSENIFVLDDEEEDQLREGADGDQDPGDDEEDEVEEGEDVLKDDLPDALGGGLRRGVDLTGGLPLAHLGRGETGAFSGIGVGSVGDVGHGCAPPLSKR